MYTKKYIFKVIYTVVTLNIFFVYILPEDGHRSGPKHVVVVHNKIEHEKHLLRTVVLIKVLVFLFISYDLAQQDAPIKNQDN
jgi:hypothetical protein